MLAVSRRFAITTHPPNKNKSVILNFFSFSHLDVDGTLFRTLTLHSAVWELSRNMIPPPPQLHKSLFPFLFFFNSGIDTTITSIQIMEIQQMIDRRYCSRMLHCGWVSLPGCPDCFWNLFNSRVLRLEWKPKLHVEIHVCLHCSLSKSTLGTWKMREWDMVGISKCQ